MIKKNHLPMHPNDAPSLIPSWLFRDQLVTKADLDAFKQDLLLSLARLMQENATKPPKKWLKSHAVMALLHISHGTLYSMRSSSALPFKKIGNIIYYDQDEISDALLPGRSIASAVGRPFKKKPGL
jgi:hypothetical protein